MKQTNKHPPKQTNKTKSNQNKPNKQKAQSKSNTLLRSNNAMCCRRTQHNAEEIDRKCVHRDICYLRPDGKGRLAAKMTSWAKTPKAWEK